MVKADHVKPSKEHFQSFIKMMNDKDSLFTIMEYLMTIDLSDFKVREIPNTETAKNMKHRNIPFIYFFMDYLVKNDKYKDVFSTDDYRVKSNQIIIKKGVFKREYEAYCSQNGMAHQYVGWVKQVMPLLHDVGVTTRKKSRFEDYPEHSIQFNSQVVTKCLVNKIVKEDEDDTEE